MHDRYHGEEVDPCRPTGRVYLCKECDWSGWEADLVVDFLDGWDVLELRCPECARRQAESLDGDTIDLDAFDPEHLPPQDDDFFHQDRDDDFPPW